MRRGAFGGLLRASSKVEGLPAWPPARPCPRRVQEGADHGDLRRAFYAKSRLWHPDKRPEEERTEATVMFQRINAAYQACVGFGWGRGGDG